MYYWRDLHLNCNVVLTVSMNVVSDSSPTIPPFVGWGPSQQSWCRRPNAGPGTDDAALLKGALQQQAKLEGQSSLGSFDSADLFSAEEALRAGLDPIDIDGLQILTDPDMAVISDPAAEEAFRLDRS